MKNYDTDESFLGRWIAGELSEEERIAFEQTDAFIEKSIRAIFDLFETTALESVLDLGKFLWKERMA